MQSRYAKADYEADRKVENMEKSPAQEKLVVVWSSADREVALHMVFMYTKNSKLKEWWKNVCLVVWGPSAKLLTEDDELQDELVNLKKAGVELQACKACADRYGVSAQLENLGVDVVYMGKPLTDYLKGGCSVLTF